MTTHELLASVLFLASLLVLLFLGPANECVHDVASISAAAGIPLVPDVLTVAGFPAFVGVPGFVILLLLLLSMLLLVFLLLLLFLPAFYGIFAVSSFPANPGIPMLL